MAGCRSWSCCNLCRCIVVVVRNLCRHIVVVVALRCRIMCHCDHRCQWTSSYRCLLWCLFVILLLLHHVCLDQPKTNRAPLAGISAVAVMVTDADAVSAAAAAGAITVASTIATCAVTCNGRCHRQRRRSHLYLYRRHHYRLH